MGGCCSCSCVDRWYQCCCRRGCRRCCSSSKHRLGWRSLDGHCCFWAAHRQECRFECRRFGCCHGHNNRLAGRGRPWCCCWRRWCCRCCCCVSSCRCRWCCCRCRCCCCRCLCRMLRWRCRWPYLCCVRCCRWTPTQFGCVVCALPQAAQAKRRTAVQVAACLPLHQRCHGTCGIFFGRPIFYQSQQRQRGGWRAARQALPRVCRRRRRRRHRIAAGAAGRRHCKCFPGDGHASVLHHSQHRRRRRRRLPAARLPPALRVGRRCLHGALFQDDCREGCRRRRGAHQVEGVAGAGRCRLLRQAFAGGAQRAFQVGEAAPPARVQQLRQRVPPLHVPPRRLAVLSRCCCRCCRAGRQQRRCVREHVVRPHSVQHQLARQHLGRGQG